MDDVLHPQRTPPRVPHFGALKVDDYRAALAYLEPNDPALQAMVDGTAPFDLSLLTRVLENTLPFWRATFKDRRLGLWAILVHFFEKADGEGGKKAQRKERDGRTRLHPSAGRRDLDILDREVQLLSLLLALLDRLNTVAATSRPRVSGSFLQEILKEKDRLDRVEGLDKLVAYFVKLLACVVQAQAGKVQPESAHLPEAFNNLLFQAFEEPTMVHGGKGARRSVALLFVEKLVTLNLAQNKYTLQLCFLPLLENVLRRLSEDKFKNISHGHSRLLLHLYTAFADFDERAQPAGPSLASAVCSDSAGLLATLLPIEQATLLKRIKGAISLKDKKQFHEAISSLDAPEPVTRQRESAKPSSSIRSFFSSSKPLQAHKRKRSAEPPLLGKLPKFPRSEPTSLPASLSVATSFSSSIAITTRAPSPFPPIAFASSILTFPPPTSLNIPRTAVEDLDDLSESAWFGGCSSAVRRMSYRDKGGKEVDLVVKYGTYGSMEEADILRFLGAKTTLPVPEVIAVEQNNTQEYGYQYELYLSYLPGEPLDLALKTLYDQARSNLSRTFSTAFSQLLSLEPPPGFIGNISKPFGASIAPFLSTPDLPRPINCHQLAKFFTSISFDPSSPLTFIHGDVAARNILVNRETGHLVGVVDWEQAGWWPVGVEREVAVFDLDLGQVQNRLNGLPASVPDSLLVDSLPTRRDM